MSRAKIGDNSNEVVNANDLKQIIARIEKREEDKAAVADDIKAIYAEAKARGFDTKTIRAVIRLKNMDAQKRREQREFLDLYCGAVGLED